MCINTNSRMYNSQLLNNKKRTHKKQKRPKLQTTLPRTVMYTENRLTNEKSQ